MSTDFTMKPSFDATSVARLAQDQAQKQAALDQETEQNQANNILAAAKAATDMVSASVEASKARQKREAIKSLSNSVAAQVPNISAPTMGPTVDNQPMQPTMVPNYNAQNQVRAAVKLNPESWTKELANQMMQTPLEKQKAQVEFNKATAGGRSLSPESKAVLTKLSEQVGLPLPDLANYTEDQGNQHIDRLIKLADAGKKDITLSDKEEQFLTNKRIKFSELTNYEKSARGASGQAAGAIRGIGQLQQLFDGYKDNLTPQEWEEASIAWSRVLASGGGQSSRQQVEALLPNTARGDVKKAMQWFTNNPTGTDQQAFAERLKVGMDREEKYNTQYLKSRTLQTLGDFQSVYLKSDPSETRETLEEKGLTYDDVKKRYPKLAKHAWGSNPEKSSSGGVPTVGGTYNGAKVLKVTRIK